MPAKLIFELSGPGRKGYALPVLDVPEKNLEELLGTALRSSKAALPEVSEVDVVRHFIQLSTMNHHIDKGFYPLGSCTMKYNPKINEDVARLPGFAALHPLQAEESVQGALKLMWELQKFLCEIGGVDGITLQPAAGAQGELTGLFITRAYHEKQGKIRNKVLIPDSAHGTNPASVTISGYQVVHVKSNSKGLVDVEDLKRNLSEEVACFMLTNPNTLGLFESEILEISRNVHETGALFYMDGANLNALLGIVKPGDMGFDMVHFNLHKTFSTPHGGGGPGAGPLGVKKELMPFLPVPVLSRTEKNGQEKFYWDYKRPDSIGSLHTYYGNFGMFVRAYTYILHNGPEGLREVAENAILNANYLMENLKDYYHLPYHHHCQHEFVLSGINQKAKGVRTMDIAKRILDFGLHAPTVYFPLVISEALMIEPTETESKESLDDFIKAMIQIAGEVETNPELVRSAPHNTPVGRLDEVKAAKDLNVKWTPQ